VEEALRFYRDVIGLGVVTGFPSAAFLAAGDYHHHLAVNTWRGEGVPPVPEGVVGLRHWTVVLDGGEQVEAVRARVDEAGIEAEARDGGFLVRDPWGSAMLIEAA
jgi:catechol 2,3-dioxygenase